MEDRIGRLALAPPSFCGPISMDTVFLYPGNTSTTCVFPYAFSLGFAFGSAPNLTFPAYFSTAAPTSSCVYTNLPLLVSRLNLSGIPAAALELADVILEAAPACRLPRAPRRACNRCLRAGQRTSSRYAGRIRAARAGSCTRRIRRLITSQDVTANQNKGLA